MDEKREDVPMWVAQQADWKFADELLNGLGELCTDGDYQSMFKKFQDQFKKILPSESAKARVRPPVDHDDMQSPKKAKFGDTGLGEEDADSQETNRVPTQVASQEVSDAEVEKDAADMLERVLEIWTAEGSSEACSAVVRETLCKRRRNPY